MSHNVYYGDNDGVLSGLNDEAVMGWANMGRKRHANPVVIKSGAHMGDNGAPGSNPVDPLQRLADMGMGLVRIIHQTADNPGIDTMKCCKGLLGHLDHIGAVGHGTKAQAQCARITMILIERHHVDLANPEWPGDRMSQQQGSINDVADFVLGLEGIGKARPGGVQGLGIPPNRQPGALGAVDLAQIVDAMQMIGVVMGINDAIDHPNVGIQQLIS